MKQSLKLSQQLNLSPQLKQSLKLLQLASIDLEHEIQEVLDSNPLLERDESEPRTADQADAGDHYTIPQPIAESADPSFEIEQTDYLAPEQDLSSSLEGSSSMEESFATQRAQNSVSNATQSSEFSHTLSQQESLFDHLHWQIMMTSLSDKDRLIARTLLRSLDDEGYLRATCEEIAQLFDQDLEVETDEVNAVLSLIKTLDPVGVGAHGLSDRLCILLAQSSADETGKALAYDIINNHIDLLATRNLAQLKKALGVDDQQLKRSLALITQLNPRVSNRFKSETQDYIVPDLVVKKVGSQWRMAINPDNQCKLKINQTYAELLNKKIDPTESDYINQQLLEAKQFIKGLMSRYDTLLMVGNAIVERQQAFFEHGEEQMLPMVLHDIADQLDLHESTISRATAGKYLLSPRGVFELKYFFSSALANREGASSSSTAIRSIIRKMVEAESKLKPLSDSKIAKELEQQGHVVARRTVAKYRESMQIAPSSQRKSLVQ